MSEAELTDIGAAVLDESFPDVDIMLRRGRHIDREDTTWYAFLTAAQSVLEPLYRRFGCELVHKSDGYFYLLPTTDQLGRRQLSVSEMLVGQALALLYLDPRTLQSGGNVARQEVLAHLAAVMGTDALLRAFNPKKKRLDERVAQETVRSRVAEALRKLAALGFVELLEGEQLRLRAALMRFAEPVRGLDSPLEALQKLVAKGEVVLHLNDDAADVGADLDGNLDAADDEARDDEAEDEEPVEDDLGAATDGLEEYARDELDVEGELGAGASEPDDPEGEDTHEELDVSALHEELWSVVASENELSVAIDGTTKASEAALDVEEPTAPDESAAPEGVITEQAGDDAATEETTTPENNLADDEEEPRAHAYDRVEPPT